MVTIGKANQRHLLRSPAILFVLFHFLLEVIQFLWTGVEFNQKLRTDKFFGHMKQLMALILAARCAPLNWSRFLGVPFQGNSSQVKMLNVGVQMGNSWFKAKWDQFKDRAPLPP